MILRPGQHRSSGRALLEELGDRYRSYAEGHKRLVPFVW